MLRTVTLHIHIALFIYVDFHYGMQQSCFIKTSIGHRSTIHVTFFWLDRAYRDHDRQQEGQFGNFFLLQPGRPTLYRSQSEANTHS